MVTKERERSPRSRILKARSYSFILLFVTAAVIFGLPLSLEVPRSQCHKDTARTWDLFYARRERKDLSFCPHFLPPLEQAS